MIAAINFIVDMQFKLREFLLPKERFAFDHEFSFI